jgi:hypothetical protein
MFRPSLEIFKKISHIIEGNYFTKLFISFIYLRSLSKIGSLGSDKVVQNSINTVNM